MSHTSKTLARWSALAGGVAAFALAPMAAEAARGGVRHAAPASIHGGGQHRAANVDRSRNISGATRNTNRSGNRNTNINTGDVNIGNRNTNINIDGRNNWNYWDDNYRPVARGVAFGAAAAVTSAVVGSMIYSLPPSCAPYPYRGYTYYSCGGVWYEPRYQGTTVTYVVINPPR